MTDTIKHGGRYITVKKILTTRNIAVIALFAAVSAALSMLEIPVGFAPSFYKLDLAEIPVLIVTFAFGPAAGVLTDVVRLLLKLLLKGSTSAFVGSVANIVMESAFIIPAGLIYRKNRTKKGAAVGCIAGTAAMTVVAALTNVYFLLPTYAVLYGMPIEALVGMGTKVNAMITSVWSLVLLAVVPFNILKGAVVSFITMLIYKPVSRLIRYSAGR